MSCKLSKQNEEDIGMRNKDERVESSALLVEWKMYNLWHIEKNVVGGWRVECWEVRCGDFCLWQSIECACGNE